MDTCKTELLARLKFIYFSSRCGKSEELEAQKTALKELLKKKEKDDGERKDDEERKDNEEKKDDKEEKEEQEDKNEYLEAWESLCK